MIIGLITSFVLGLCLGSFSLVLAWRMHDKKDWVKGRSECDACHHELNSADLIPIISYLSLRGRCRYCKKPISREILFAETGLGVVLALSFWFWPYGEVVGMQIGLFILWAFICTLMSALFWYDLRWFLLPNRIVYPLIVASLAFVAYAMIVNDTDLSEGLILPLLGALFLSGIFFCLHTFSRGKWIGFGDVRLGIALGLLAGSPIMAWMLLFIASVLGVAISLPSMLSGKRKLTSKIPFGPLLITAGLVTVIFGQQIVDFYLNFASL